MKRIIISLIAVVAIATSCSTKPEIAEGMFLIEGAVKNVPDSSIIKLVTPMGGGVFKQLATDTIIDGQFKFYDSIPDIEEPLRISSSSDGFTYASIYIWADSKSHIIITGKGGALESWNIKSDNLMQKEENNYLQYMLPVAEKSFELSKELNKANDLMYDKIFSKQDYREEYKVVDSLRALYDVFDDDISLKKLEYLESTPVSEHWMLKYFTFAKYIKYEKDASTASKIKSIYELIPQEYLATSIGQDITSYIHPLQIVGIGDTIPDIALFDLEGEQHSLSELKGKYILLDFWSCGCSPCIYSFPELKEISETYKDKLTVVSISTDGEKAWEKAVKEHGLDGYQWNEKTNAPRLNMALNISGIPSYVLLNPDGTIKDIWSGYGTGSLKSRLQTNFD